MPRQTRVPDYPDEMLCAATDVMYEPVDLNSSDPKLVGEP